MKKYENKNLGITLVALVITIVILLILAGISISTLTNTGIFQKAKDAKDASENAEKEQKQTLNEYEKELNKYTAQELTNDKVNKVLSETENTILKDVNENIFTLPAGFKVVVNDDTGNAKTVDKGIVIEDATSGATAGSQFVWIPVGTITKADGKTTTINLDRYTFDSNGNPIAQGEKAVQKYYQELNRSDKGNTVAKSIANFKSSVTANGGYYISRYEARKNATSGKLTEVNSDSVWNNITQPDAATQARNMYDEQQPFTSDLMNSYAWDTAITFIQNCTDKTNYANQTSLNTSFLSTGTKNDNPCNIFDMASNVWEWTTETSSDSDGPCVGRGGGCFGIDGSTSIRDGSGASRSHDDISFRPLLYVNV